MQLTRCSNMYGNVLRSLLLLLILPCLGFGSNLSVQTDTIPPEIITFPEDLTVPCGVPYQQQFDSWLENHAGLAVSDDGDVNLFTTFSGIIDDEVISSSDTLCGNTAMVPIGFYAIDDCQNSSDTVFANFIVQDIFQPIITQEAQDKTIQCDEAVVDSLQTWLDNIGGATANDVCDNDAIWDNYIWNDNLGNSGFSFIGDTTDIKIIRSSCDWSVVVSFFVLDECGNANITTSSFAIIDTIAPQIFNLLTDTIIACVDTIPNVVPDFIDGCQGLLEIQTETESTQGADPNECSFYNYTVTSSYMAEDICGNQNMVLQQVQVVDTLAPIIVANQEININCEDDQTEISNYIDNIIDCSPVEITFIDSLQNSSPCSNTFRRSWTFLDVCGNQTMYRQIVNVIDQTGPQITDPIPSLDLECSQIVNFDQTILSFVENLENLTTSDNCGEGNIYINGGEDPNVINFDFQFIPTQTCNGSPVIQQESVAITLEDDCGNFEQATSSITIVDTIAPEILNCQESLNFELELGECDLKIPLAQFDIGNQCDSTTAHFLFKRQIQLDSFTPETGSIVFNWEFSPAETESIVDGAKIEFTSEGIVNNNLGLDFIITSSDATELFNYSEPLSLCESQNFNFDVPFDQTKKWIEEGSIQLTVDYEILETFDCPEEARLGFTISIPSLVDTPNKYSYTLDGGQETEYSVGDSITISSGMHRIIYSVEDCGGNKTNCTQEIEIRDLETPELICPDGFTLIIPEDTCAVEFRINPVFQFIENCSNNSNFSITLPEENDRFLKFSEQENGVIIADNIQFQFEDINLDNIILNPVLIVELLANTTVDNGFFSIRDENGETIGSTPQSLESCISTQLITFDLTIDQLEEWNSDQIIVFNFVNTNITLGGLAPCSPEDFNGQTDMSSFLTATLAFTEIVPNIVVTNEESGDTIESENGFVAFDTGNYLVELSSSDNSGNIASCSYFIEVEDNTPPEMMCSNVDILIAIQDLEAINPDINIIDFDVTDNCDSVSLDLNSPMIDCTDIGSELLASLIATDENGNENICEFNFTPIGIELKPSFSSSLCGGESLSLLNNIPENITVSYQWSGPSGFSSEEANPQIENVSSANSGTYSLQATTEAGCNFFGNVEVTIEALSNPEIVSDNDIICVGDAFVLNSNAFDDVVYLWYEGLAPNGNLVGMSTISSIELTPSIGTHFYYSIVEGNGCQSDPSNSYAIEVIDFPIALVEDNFITTCEGETISLTTANTNPSLEFSWSGPGEYESNEANPTSINNIGINQQGTYQLVVSDRGCLSDPALVEVVVFNTPDKPILVGDNLLCEGSDLSLTVMNNVSSDKYNWFLNGETYSTTNTNSLIIPNAQDQLAGNWTVIIEDDNCTSLESEIFIIDIESQITIGANNNGPICEGGMVTLTASFIPEADYIWTTPNNLEFFGRVVSVPAVNGVYSVELTTSAGCLGEANTIVEIIQVPEVTALSNNSSACMSIGDPISFFPSIFPPGEYQFIWTGPNSFISTEEELTIPFQGIASNGIYGLQIQNDNCVSDIIFTEVSSTIIPDQAVITQNGPLCLGASINLIASNVSADIDEYIWATPIGQIITAEPALTISPSSNINIGEYSLTVSTNGCMSEPSQSINLILEDALDQPIITGNNILCAGQELVLEPSNPIAGLDYIWIGPDGTNYSSTILTIENFSETDAGAYVVQSSINSCVSDFSEPFVVTIISSPEAPILSMNEFTFCENNLTEISLQDFINTANVDSYFLYDPTGLLIAESGNGDFIDVNLSAYSEGSYQFFVTQSIADCESDLTAPITIIIESASQAASFAETELLICELGVTSIAINIPNGIDTEIIIQGDNMIIENILDNEIIVNVFDVGNSQLIVNSSNDICGEFESDILDINVLEDIDAINDEFTILGVNSTMISVLENDQYNSSIELAIENLIGGPGLSVVGDMIQVTTNNLIGTYSFNYTICSIECPALCDEAIVTLNIEGENIGSDCTPFNLMTPNGDGENDFFIVPCTESGDNVEVKIFNSFGALIYAEEDYQNDWMGTKDGDDVPVGTYFYYVKINEDAPMAAFLVVER